MAVARGGRSRSACPIYIVRTHGNYRRAGHRTRTPSIFITRYRVRRSRSGGKNNSNRTDGKKNKRN